MKIILSGYERTKTIMPTCAYLLEQYLPSGFDIVFLNNQGGVDEWSEYMRNYLSTLSDKLIIMGDGDMLVNCPMNKKLYKKLLSGVKGDVVCARLCYGSFYKDDEYIMKNEIMTLTDKAPYSAVLQYCIWNREFLIDLLKKTTNPWNFEDEGSKILNQSGKKVIGSLDGALSYYETGAFSHEQKSDKIRVNGVSQKDLDYLLKIGYLEKENIYVE